MGPSLLYVWICKSGAGGRRPWQPVAVRGAARLRGRIWNPPIRALCSKVFLRSYCSTPTLKRKIKIFLQTVPFVPTPAAFFFGGGWGCYPAHIFCRSRAAGVGIHGTVFYRLYCYRRHSLPGSLFYTGCYPAHNSGVPELESPAQFAADGVVIGSTISVRCAARGKKYRLLSGAQFRLCLRAAGCYPQHNLRGVEN